MLDQLIESRPNWRLGFDPLWKLKVTDDEYKTLIEYVQDKVYLGIDSSRWNREAALLFSEWWKREYVGGPHNTRDIAVFLDLEDYETALYKAAIAGVKPLRIKFIKRLNTRRLDTLFLQGGLPLGALSKNEGVNRYERYLNTIVKYICSHDIKWESTDFIQNFNPYISKSFHNEVMYDLTLQIARAIYFEDNAFFPFNVEDNKLEQLITSLRKTKKETPRIIREIPFQAKWIIEKTGNDLKLFYQIEYENIISKNWVDNNLRNIDDPFRTIDLNVNNKSSVQRYIRKNNGDYAAKYSNQQITGQIDDFSTSVLQIQLTTNTNKIFDFTIPNCDIPDLNEPTLLTQLDTKNNTARWRIVNNPVAENVNAVVCSKNWNSENGQDVSFNDENLNWFEFAQAITITNVIDFEELKYDTNFLLDYRVDFGIPMIDWIQKSNYFIIISNPEIKVYDFEDKMINHSQYMVHYRLKGNNDWTLYNLNQSLPIGLIEFKVHIKGQSPIRKKFYHAGRINYKIIRAEMNAGSIEWEWDNGLVTPIKMNDGIEVQKTYVAQRWDINYNQDFRIFPKTIKFELRSYQDQNTRLVIEVGTPFKGVVLLDPVGKLVSENQIICANALLGYRCLVMGIDVIPITIQFFKNKDEENPIAEEEIRFYKGLENSLQMLDVQLKTIFKINKHSIFDFYDKSNCRIKFGSDFSVNVELFNGDTFKEGMSFIIKDYQNVQISDFPYPVYAVPVNCEPEDIEVYELLKQTNGNFSFKEDANPHSEVIIFSQTSSNTPIHLRPRYHNLNNILNAEDIPEETRMELHKAKIYDVQQVLTESDLDHNSWKVVEKYFEIVIDRNLPFETFTCFSAISKDKKLMTRMATLLFARQNREKARMNYELNRFENEYANAWHWISRKYWDAAINDIITAEKIDVRFHKDFRDELFQRILSLLSFKSINQEAVNEFFRGVFAGINYGIDVRGPSGEDKRFEKRKFNNDNGLKIPEYISRCYPVIPFNFRKLFLIDQDELKLWGGMFLSPIFSALAFSGKNEVFTDRNSKISNRHRIFYYMDLDPEWYFFVFEKIVKQIIQAN